MSQRDDRYAESGMLCCWLLTQLAMACCLVSSMALLFFLGSSISEVPLSSVCALSFPGC